MKVDSLLSARNTVIRRHPLIHCITNPISINLCANAILSVGARPIMAEHPLETEEITRSADALMLNLGNITDARIASVTKSAAVAQENGIPFLLDVVGISCSALRRNLTDQLLQSFRPAVIKGNYSEINTLNDFRYLSSGVDASPDLSLPMTLTAAAQAARKYHTVVLASGKTDLITDGNQVILIHNGSARLSQITGTGCLQGALVTCFLSSTDALTACVTGCGLLGIVGELAGSAVGNGSYAVALIDQLSLMDDTTFLQYLRMEEQALEIV